MYSPRLSGGAISAAYAELPGIRIISPNVQITTAANRLAVFPNGAIPTSAYDPNPAAYKNAPSISVCRCVQCAIAVFNGTSSATISKVFTVKIVPNTDSGKCRYRTRNSGNVDVS